MTRPSLAQKFEYYPITQRAKCVYVCNILHALLIFGNHNRNIRAEIAVLLYLNTHRSLEWVLRSNSAKHSATAIAVCLTRFTFCAGLAYYARHTICGFANGERARTRLLFVCTISTLLLYIWRDKSDGQWWLYEHSLKFVSRLFACMVHRKARPEDEIQYMIAEKPNQRQNKAHVNREFFRQLRELLSKYKDNFGMQHLNMYLYMFYD